MSRSIATRVPSFCRHNRLIQNCPICSREQAVALRPVVSPGAPKSSLPRDPAPSRSGSPRIARSKVAGDTRPGGARVVVRRLARGADDGFASPLVPGLRSSEDADRLALELAYSTSRLLSLVSDPPGLYAEVGDSSIDLEERTWLAFLIAYLGPLADDEPFAAIESVRTSWSSGLLPELDGVQVGPRGAHEPGRGGSTLEAYRAWAARSGSQAAAIAGEAAWPPERRFARAFERLALPGMTRDARFDLLVVLGRLGCYDVRAGALALGGGDEATLAAKRLLGIGDSLLLERRAAALAEACEVPLESLDLALHNWGSAGRIGLGVSADLDPDAGALASARSALGL
jgi:hypothetical protein